MENIGTYYASLQIRLLYKNLIICNKLQHIFEKRTLRFGYFYSMSRVLKKINYNHNNFHMKDERQIQKLVIIIGAGPAGIGSAITLSQQGIPHIILEARNRMGGRTVSQTIQGVSVDLGASWIHAYSETNILKQYVQKLKIREVDLSDRLVQRKIIDSHTRQQFPNPTINNAYKNAEQVFETAKRQSVKHESDKSVYQLAIGKIQNLKTKITDSQFKCTSVIINLTERHEGSSIKQLSAKNFDFQVDKGVNFLPQGGYYQLYQQIANKYSINVLYSKIVVSIQISANQVKITCRDGTIFYGSHVVVSLPLGVLKSGKVKFIPQLPLSYQESIAKLGIGLMNKIIVCFENNFWGPVAWINIASQKKGKFTQIYNFSQNGTHILCCFITGDYARACQKQSKEELFQQFLSFLCSVYGRQRIKPKTYYITNWGQDEFSLGSYSSFHFGSSPLDSYRLRRPIENIMWLVGQHCYAEYIGTAHGAFSTGVWASQQIISKIEVKDQKKQNETLPKL